MKKAALTAFLATVFLFGNVFILLSKRPNIVSLYPTSQSYFGLLSAAGICFLSIAVLLEFLRRNKPEYYDKMSLVVIFCSFYNLTDFVLFSVLSTNNITKIISVSVGLIYLPVAIWGGIQYGSAKILRTIQIGLLPPAALLLFYYGIPREVMTSSLEKKYTVSTRKSAHLIIFDGLSWDVLFKEGTIEPNFPNFREFSQSAHICTKVYPTGGDTKQSLSQLITGRRYDGVSVDPKGLLVHDGGLGGFIPLPAEESIFKTAAAAGYNNVVIGFYLPYLDSFGPFVTRGVPVLGNQPLYAKMLQRLPRIILFPGYVYSDNGFGDGLRYYIQQLMELPPNTFFYVHLNQPHALYPYNNNGQVMSRLEYYKYLLNGNQENYYRNSVVHLDRELGELIALLKRTGKYDDSLIIITSDHNYLDYKSPYVPLLIKAPYQQQSITCGESMDMIHFKSFIESYFHSGKVDVGILRTN